MKIDGATDTDALNALGNEAVRLLGEKDIKGLAGRFGYALAYNRNPAAAIEQDLNSCLAEIEASSVAPTPTQTPTVKYFGPNDTGLFAVVECVALADNGAKLLVELIVTDKEGEKFATLEHISVAA